MKKIVIAVSFIALSIMCNAQKLVDLKENEPITENGLEYGYTITNEQNKSVKGEDYDRFELELYVRNKSGCLKLFPFKTNALGELSDNNDFKLAEFNVKNATGKRLTSKGGKLEANAIRTMVQVATTQASSNTNNGFVQALLGYGVRSSDYIRNTIIVILPKGERPVVTCRTFYLQEVVL